MSEYADWALKLVAVIAADSRIDAQLRLAEIEVATRPDDAFSESFKDGETPEAAWEGEVGSIADSQ